MRSVCSEQPGRVTPTESTASAAATAMVGNSPADLPQCASFLQPPAPGTRQVLPTTSGSFTSTVTAAYSTAEDVEPRAPGLNWLSSGILLKRPAMGTRQGRLNARGSAGEVRRARRLAFLWILQFGQTSFIWLIPITPEEPLLSPISK